MMNRSKVEAQLERLKAGIALDAPKVAEFFDSEAPLEEYSRSLYGARATTKQRTRQSVFKAAVRTQLGFCFDDDEIEQANIDWEGDWTLNIFDHHVLLNHPFPLATNIIANMHQLPSTQPKGVVVLSDSGVPLTNALFKRGFHCQDKQLNVVPHRQRHQIVYKAPLLDKLPLQERAAKQGLARNVLDELDALSSELVKESEYPALRGMADQVTRLNRTLWPRLFDQSLRNRLADIFYVANENVCVELLRQYLGDSGNLFTRILCEREARDRIILNFAGINGCWDPQGPHGSHLFWGLDDNGAALRLELENDTLVNPEKGFTLELDARAIIDALDEGRIYPTLFLAYGISVFYCGIRPLVGFGSLNYMAAMKAAWVETLKELEPNELDDLASISTHGFIGGPVVTYEATKDGYKELYALDLILKGGLNEDYLGRLRQQPFNSLLMPSLTDIYELYVRPDHKDEITITPSDLMGEAFGWLHQGDTSQKVKL